jgi:hypothetical protein
VKFLTILAYLKKKLKKWIAINNGGLVWATFRVCWAVAIRRGEKENAYETTKNRRKLVSKHITIEID